MAICKPWRDSSDPERLDGENGLLLTPSIDRLFGKPVIRGTRLTVELLLRELSEGATESDLLDAYPQLTREDIKAAIAYAADTVARERHSIIGQN